MKTHLRPFILWISVFVILFTLSIIISQESIYSNITEISGISIFLLIGIMLLAGILDGFNPCAFSTLLLWIGFLLNNFNTQMNGESEFKHKQKMIRGFAIYYTIGIFLVYFIFGTGALLITDMIRPSSISLLTKIAGLVVVILGLITLRDSMSKGKTKVIKMPKVLYPLVKKFSKPTTKFAALISGFVIGLCTIPCSGAIYMAVLVILNTKFQSVMYPILLVYNIGFVLPVIILTLAISNKKILTYVSQDFLKSKSLIRLILSIVTILLGLITIYFV